MFYNAAVMCFSVLSESLGHCFPTGVTCTSDDTWYDKLFKENYDSSLVDYNKVCV